MKYIKILLFLFPFIGLAQDYSSSWEGHFSFFNVNDISYGNNKIYAAAQNAIFSYDNNTGEVEKISTINGLSGEDIAKVHFSTAYGLLIIGFENGLIQVYNPAEKKILNFIDIVNKPTISANLKHINNLTENEGNLYIATDYGISVFNLQNVEFGDTYYIGNNGSQLAISQVGIFQGKIYAATKGEGIKYAPLNSNNLIDYNIWQTVDLGTYGNVFSFQQKLYVQKNNGISELQTNGTLIPVIQFTEAVRNISVNEDYVSVSLDSGLKVYDQQFGNVVNIQNSTGFTPNFSSSLIIGTDLFIGDFTLGLLKTSMTNTSVLDRLSPVGPLRNDVFKMDIENSELWVVYGEYDIYFNPYPKNNRGVSFLKNGQWNTVNYGRLLGASNLVNVTINPANTNEVFLSSYTDGLLKMQGKQAVTLFNESNSNLPNNDIPNAIEDTRINGAVFDDQGNLWVLDSRANEGLAMLPAGGSNFETYDVSDIIQDPTLGKDFTQIVVDNSNNLYFGSTKDGIVGYNPRTSTFAKVSGRINGGDVLDDRVFDLALDKNNQLWFGTGRGLRVLFSPSQMFSNANISASNIVIRDEDGVAQELFANVSISSITVDGNNKKWIGTDAGVFYISSDGQKTIHHFTTENSPLPSNVINDITVDDETGWVYIGTPKGLVSYRGTATEGAESLKNLRAYPNPVRPGYSGMVTIDGLIDNANVKITDIEGNLVYEETSEGGSIQWDTTAFGKYKVASGVYLILVTSEDQAETKIAKVMVIR